MLSLHTSTWNYDYCHRLGERILVLADVSACPGTQGGHYLQTLKMGHNYREQDFVPALKQTFKQSLILALSLSRHW